MNESRFLTSQNGLSYQDLTRLHMIRRGKGPGQRLIPEWSQSDECVRTVVLEKLCRYCRYYGLATSEVSLTSLDVHELTEVARIAPAAMQKYLADESIPESQKRNIRSHLAVNHNRAEVLVAIIYRAYRLGRTSVDIGTELGIAAPTVRQVLRRLNDTARILFPDRCTAPRTYGGRLSRRNYLDKLEADARRLLSRMQERKSACLARIERLNGGKRRRDPSLELKKEQELLARYNEHIAARQARLDEIVRLQTERDAERRKVLVYSAPRKESLRETAAPIAA
jgi:hypothetical protein